MKKSEYLIGTTGHRFLPPDALSEISAAVNALYQNKVDEFGGANITVLSSVAEGADTLCAKLALSCGISLVAPLPMSAEEYSDDFTGSAATEFDQLLALADKVFIVIPDEQIPVDPNRGFYYRQAGRYIAKHCDMLLAIWDGIEKNTPDGAGTWETVKLAREFGKPVHHIAVAYNRG